jgi:group I intron endonuclease
MPKAGVYAIQNLESGRMYVGSSNNIRRRWNEHRSMLDRSDHICHELQADWSTYGAGAFAFVILALSEDVAARIVLEQFYIDGSAVPYNTNKRAGSGPRPGYRHTSESKLKMRQARLGKTHTPEAKAKLSAYRTGRPNPVQADALRGRKLSEETKAKMSAAKLGKHVSEETRAKLAAINTGRQVTWGASISASKRGKPWSEARRAAYEKCRLK